MRNKPKAAGLVLALLTAGGLLLVHDQTLRNVENYNMEFSFMKQKLVLHRGPLSRIHIVLPPPQSRGYNGRPTVDDTFNDRTVSHNFDYDTVNLLRAALQDARVPASWWLYACRNSQRECVSQMPRGYRLLVTHSVKGEVILATPNMVVIDFNDL